MQGNSREAAVGHCKNSVPARFLPLGGVEVIRGVGLCRGVGLAIGSIARLRDHGTRGVRRHAGRTQVAGKQ